MNTQDERLQDNSDRSFFLILFFSLILFLVIAIGYWRRRSIAPRVCPILCETLKTEYYYAWEDLDWGIRCVCDGKVKSKKVKLKQP